ncbi:Phosphatidylinositol/phosphatidylcholine transfer protein [Actinidia chinensis var. chinensis]|uniref:Phosphatidylinositol/phosphatidylcholine transfer protein n=1 Tax=Actinidia chinensis var. chinensis TaxID=1590841 RepID=A0A2R6QG55_ACTCC|nr:Phosphatidylinositol/phosphatidylcholine transfer protein [Actinidia chinensis var. chinensis]
MEQQTEESLNKTVTEEAEAKEATTKTSVICIHGSNEEEHNKICLMRASVEKQDSSSKDVDDFMIRRFLRARDLDIGRASVMFLKYLKWRRTFVPNGFISRSEVPNEIEQNKMFMQGLDKQGRPITVLFAGRHFLIKGGLDEFKRFVVLSLDKICSRMPTGQEKFTVIGDLEGWGYTNSDIRGYLGALAILQDNYPERLGKVFIIHAPYIFMAVWKVIYPFIDNNTKKKIVFVENKKLRSTLLEDIDESQLPEIYGGKLPLVPIQDS